MKVLLVSEEGWGSTLLRKIGDAGHGIGAVVTGTQSYGVGFFPTFSDVEEAMREFGPDLIVVDDVGLSRKAIPYRGKLPILGASSLLSGLGEFFPSYAENLKSAGIRTAPYRKYASAKSASRALYNRADPEGSERIDYKGRLIQIETSRGRVYETFCCEGREAADRLEILPEGPCCILDVSSSCVYSIMGLFDGERFPNPIHLNVEVHPGSIEGCFISQSMSDQDKLFKITLGKFARYLKQTGFVGPVEMDFILTPEGEVLVTDLEFGFQKVLAETWSFGLEEDLAGLLKRLCYQNVSYYSYTDEAVAGCAYGLPEWSTWDMPWLPIGKEKEVRRLLMIPSVGYKVSPPDLTGDSGWMPAMVAKDDDQQMRTTGPLIGIVLGRGDTPGEATSEMAKAGGTLKVPGAGPIGTSAFGFELSRLYEAKLVGRKS